MTLPVGGARNYDTIIGGGGLVVVGGQKIPSIRYSGVTLSIAIRREPGTSLKRLDPFFVRICTKPELTY